MEKKKIILSLLGLAALVVPVILLIVFTGNKAKQPNTQSGERKVDPQAVQSVVNKYPTPPPVNIPSPTPATPSAKKESSPSAR